MSDENITAPTTTDFSLNPKLSYIGTKKSRIHWKLFKTRKITYAHGKIVNIYIVYEISKSCNISLYATLENCLFGAVSLTKNADIDK